MTDSAGIAVGSLFKGGQNSRPGEFNSFYLIERCGEEGRGWVERYRRSKCAGLVQKIDSALMSLRNRRYEEGKRLLSEVGSGLKECRNEPGSISLVLEHLFFGVVAYAHYCDDDFDGADRFVGLAEKSLTMALESQACLVPLAARFLDFGFQRIRIARNRQRWADMRNRVQEVRGMLEDRVPLCDLKEIGPIFLQSLMDFYRSADLEKEELQFIDEFFEYGKRIADFEKSVYKLYALAGPVIPYP